MDQSVSKRGNKLVIVGAGFAGLASAALLANKGCEVVVLEKNAGPGGRAQVYERDGFRSTWDRRGT
jgi:phytoene desaturase